MAPVLFVVGLITFPRRRIEPQAKALGRIAIGLGLTLLSLHILLGTLAPLQRKRPLTGRWPSGLITNDPVLCILIAAALTWAAYSTAAVVASDHVACTLGTFVTSAAVRSRRARSTISAAPSIRCSYFR